MLGDTWNMVNTRATCMAHVSTPSGAWSLPAGCVCWMSTPRYCLACSFPACSIPLWVLCLPPSITPYISKYPPITPQLLLGTQPT